MAWVWLLAVLVSAFVDAMQWPHWGWRSWSTHVVMSFLLANALLHRRF